jgi:hypothetical protein
MSSVIPEPVPTGLILCHTCGQVFTGGWQESHDHAADEHRDAYVTTPGDLEFTDLLANPSALQSSGSTS